MDVKDLFQLTFDAEIHHNIKGSQLSGVAPATSEATVLPMHSNKQKLSNLEKEQRDGVIVIQITNIVLGLAKHLGLRVPVWNKVKSIKYACSKLALGDVLGFKKFSVQVTTIDGRVFSIDHSHCENKLVVECANIIAMQVMANYFPELEDLPA